MRPVNDMWIVACCLAYEVPLATLNLKNYEDFKEHHGLRILGAESPCVIRCIVSQAVPWSA